MILVTYDLVDNASFEDYQRIISGIKSSFPNAVKVTESCWFIQKPLNQNFVLTALSKFIKSTDRLLVAELKTFPTGKNLLSEINTLNNSALTPKLLRNPLSRL